MAGERDCVELMQLVGAGRPGVARPEQGVLLASCKSAPYLCPTCLPPSSPQGIANRAVSATAMNAGSSRSHCVIYVVVEKAHADGRVEFGKLCLVVSAALWIATLR